jgi:hypothetical protein
VIGAVQVHICRSCPRSTTPNAIQENIVFTSAKREAFGMARMCGLSTILGRVRHKVLLVAATHSTNGPNLRLISAMDR